jgi:hypothetical protein
MRHPRCSAGGGAGAYRNGKAHHGEIPAITIPRVGKGDRGHALDEWMDTEFESNHLVKSMGLTTILAVAGAQ